MYSPGAELSRPPEVVSLRTYRTCPPFSPRNRRLGSPPRSAARSSRQQLGSGAPWSPADWHAGLPSPPSLSSAGRGLADWRRAALIAAAQYGGAPQQRRVAPQRPPHGGAPPQETWPLPEPRGAASRGAAYAAPSTPQQPNSSPWHQSLPLPIRELDTEFSTVTPGPGPAGPSPAPQSPELLSSEPSPSGLARRQRGRAATAPPGGGLFAPPPPPWAAAEAPRRWQPQPPLSPTAWAEEEAELAAAALRGSELSATMPPPPPPDPGPHADTPETAVPPPAPAAPAPPPVFAPFAAAASAANAAVASAAAARRRRRERRRCGRVCPPCCLNCCLPSDSVPPLTPRRPRRLRCCCHRGPAADPEFRRPLLFHCCLFREGDAGTGAMRCRCCCYRGETPQERPPGCCTGARLFCKRMRCCLHRKTVSADSPTRCDRCWRAMLMLCCVDTDNGEGPQKRVACRGCLKDPALVRPEMQCCPFSCCRSKADAAESVLRIRSCTYTAPDPVEPSCRCCRLLWRRWRCCAACCPAPGSSCYERTTPLMLRCRDDPADAAAWRMRRGPAALTGVTGTLVAALVMIICGALPYWIQGAFRGTTAPSGADDVTSGLFEALVPYPELRGDVYPERVSLLAPPQALLDWRRSRHPPTAGPREPGLDWEADGLDSLRDACIASVVLLCTGLMLSVLAVAACCTYIRLCFPAIVSLSGTLYIATAAAQYAAVVGDAGGEQSPLTGPAARAGWCLYLAALVGLAQALGGGLLACAQLALQHKHQTARQAAGAASPPQSPPVQPEQQQQGAQPPASAATAAIAARLGCPPRLGPPWCPARAPAAAAACAAAVSAAASASRRGPPPDPAAAAAAAALAVAAALSPDGDPAAAPAAPPTPSTPARPPEDPPAPERRSSAGTQPAAGGPAAPGADPDRGSDAAPPEPPAESAQQAAAAPALGSGKEPERGAGEGKGEGAGEPRPSSPRRFRLPKLFGRRGS